MPLLGGLLVNLFSGLVAWLSTYFTRKVAFALAAMAAYTTITVAVYVSLRATLLTLDQAMTGAPAMFVTGLKLGVPPIAPMCLASYMTIWVTCTVYVWQRDLLSLAVKA